MYKSSCWCWNLVRIVIMISKFASKFASIPDSSIGKESACNEVTRFDSWAGKICWRRDRLPTPVFWPGEFYGLYRTQDRKESDMTKRPSLSLYVCSVQFSHSVVPDSLQPHEPQHTRPPLSITNSQSPPKLTSTESVIPSNHLFLCRLLLLLPSIFPSIRVFSNESVLHIRWPKYWSFSFSFSPSNEYLGLTGLISLQSKGLSRVFSNTTVQKHQFFSAQLSL